jgi:hypothetical protein
MWRVKRTAREFVPWDVDYFEVVVVRWLIGVLGETLRSTPFSTCSQQRAPMSSDAFEEQSEASGRWVSLDIREHSAWMLLSESTSFRPVADIWVYNLIAPIPANEVHRYERSGPPPGCVGFVSAEGVRKAHADQLAFRWSPDGDAVAVEIEGEVLAFVQARPRKGWARHIIQEGPFGSPWSDEEYGRLFGR